MDRDTDVSGVLPLKFDKTHKILGNKNAILKKSARFAR